MNIPSTARSNEAGWYEIRLRGRIAPQWSTWLDGMTVTAHDDGTTVVAGSVVDQSALHGLLSRLRDVGLPLLSVAQVDSDGGPGSSSTPAGAPDPHTTNPGD